VLDCANDQQKGQEEEIDKEKIRQEVDGGEERGTEADSQEICEEGSPADKILGEKEGVEENNQRQDGARADRPATVLA